MRCLFSLFFLGGSLHHAKCAAPNIRVCWTGVLTFDNITNDCWQLYRDLQQLLYQFRTAFKYITLRYVEYTQTRFDIFPPSVLETFNKSLQKGVSIRVVYPQLCELRTTLSFLVLFPFPPLSSTVIFPQPCFYPFWVIQSDFLPVSSSQSIYPPPPSLLSPPLSLSSTVSFLTQGWDRTVSRCRSEWMLNSD